MYPLSKDYLLKGLIACADVVYNRRKTISSCSVQALREIKGDKLVATLTQRGAINVIA